MEYFEIFSHLLPSLFAILIGLVAGVTFFTMQSGMVIVENKGSIKFRKHQAK